MHTRLHHLHEESLVLDGGLFAPAAGHEVVVGDLLDHGFGQARTGRAEPEDGGGQCQEDERETMHGWKRNRQTDRQCVRIYF